MRCGRGCLCSYLYSRSGLKFSYSGYQQLLQAVFTQLCTIVCVWGGGGVGGERGGGGRCCHTNIH